MLVKQEVFITIQEALKQRLFFIYLRLCFSLPDQVAATKCSKKLCVFQGYSRLVGYQFNEQFIGQRKGIHLFAAQGQRAQAPAFDVMTTRTRFIETCLFPLIFRRIVLL